MKLKVFGHTYYVHEEKKLVEEQAALAQIRFCEKEIVFDSRLYGTTKGEALLHEIFEAVNYHLEFKMPHARITALSEAIYSVLNNNKLLVNEELIGKGGNK